MVIQKIRNTKNCRGAINYIKKKDADLIDKNTISSNPAREMQWIYSQNKNCLKPMVHIVISLCDEETLSQKEWKQLCRKYLAGIGYQNNQYIAYRHNDTKNEHIHLLVNRVQSSNIKVTDDSYNVRKGQKALAQIEKDFNLKPLPEKKEVTHESRREKRKRYQEENQKKREEMIKRKSYRDAISEAIDQSETWEDFCQFLDKKGIKVNLNNNHISYQKDNTNPIPSAKLGKKYTLNELKKYYLIEQKEEIIPMKVSDNQSTISTLLNVLGKTRNPLTINYLNESHHIRYEQGELEYFKSNAQGKQTVFKGKYEQGSWHVEENTLSIEQLKMLNQQIPEINKRDREQRQLKQKRQRQRQLQL